MPQDRPPIPAEIERQVLVEAGHRCAVCGETAPLELAHIVAWSRVRNHTADNLICLCAGCHGRADFEKWGAKTLRRYKNNPWVRQRSREPMEQPRFRHNLPFTSLGPLFHGREVMLARLRETLERTPAGRATAIAGKAIHGLGGVGKTRLAIEYGWQHAAEYSAVLFVGAGSPADLRRNLAALCSVLDLPEQAVPEEEVREAAVLRRLGELPGWLLILDNVDSPDAAAAVDALVARLHGGHVLLTGRLARWGAEVEAIELDLLAEEAAAAFLLARTANCRRATPDDAAHATTLARELGYLPLALEQAGAAIAGRRLTFPAYLKDWATRREQVLTWFDPRVSHYPVSFAVTWQTSVDRLSAPARHLLERLAWLGPEPIPESLLEVPVPGLPEESNPDPRDALAELATWSLVARAAETPTFTVHRLVQDVTRRSLRNDPGQGLLTEALRWVNAAFVGEPQDVRTWPVLDPLTPHARAVVAFADTEGITEPTARLMNRARHFAPHQDACRRGRAADATRARDRRGELRAGAPRGRHRPQQPSPIAQGHEPSRRGRAADATRARDR